ncbi:ATP-binding protein [Marinobacter pelagius]|uniref:ATP-binding protein n=1 Tax=Marinobacter sp. C7 TaxID=2951363 RepID=UPI001EEFCDEB|nr:ATP-binding protein [Marinobacter sp. C7]MCG7200506.1 ATP-binding protein [Marinobacter sp. C7]
MTSMDYWRSLPLKAKLLLLTLSVSCLGIVLVCISLVVVEHQAYKKQLESELITVASILAEQSAAAVLFRDQNQLDTIIASLRQIETIEQVCIYDANGEVLSSFQEKAGEVCPSTSGTLDEGFSEKHYTMMRPILIEGDAVGSFYLKSRLQVLREHIRKFILYALVISVTIISILVLIAFKLQRLVSQPIQELSDAVETIARDEDYSVRVRVAGDDELGRLGAAFNDMISTIQQQNRRITRSKDELERVVETRTAQLRLANSELEAFSYSVSHDLRQPLRAIEGFGLALEEDCADRLDDTGRDYLRRIRAATIRMGSLIDGLLILSRVSRKQLDVDVIDLSAMLREIVEELEEVDAAKKSVIEIEEGMKVTGDERLLRIAFQNLLQNAWKYSSRQSERRIRVSSDRQSETITVRIDDNGVGFDMKYVDKLFVSFNRLHSPSDFPGSGLGLATVYRIVNRHAGSVRAESAVDRGATFFVELPRKPDDS